MSRFRELRAVIQTIKKTGKGTNNGLAKFCKIHVSQSSRWFWAKKRGPIPDADVTLRALQWACKKYSVKSLLCPDWPTLKFELYCDLFGDWLNQDRIYQKMGIDPDLVPEGPEKGQRRYLPGREPRANRQIRARLAPDLGVTSKAIADYVPYPWGSETPDPDGEFALNLLAYHHATQDRRKEFHSFISSLLKRISHSSATPHGSHGSPTKFQRKLIASAKRLAPVYNASTFTLPAEFTPIIL